MTSLNKDRFKKALDKLVPVSSPASLKIQNLIACVVSFKPDLVLNIEFITYTLEISFTVEECNNIANKIVKAKKIEEWAVSYMLILFYKKYGVIDAESYA